MFSFFLKETTVISLLQRIDSTGDPERKGMAFEIGRREKDSK